MYSALMTLSLPAPSPYDAIKANRRMRWWYEHLADLMIANPSMKQNDLAAHFNRSPSTISLIINSDAFKAYLAQRRAEYTKTLDASVRDKLLNVADKSFDLILQRFEKKRDTIPLDSLQKLADSSLKALGYGQEKSSGPTIINNQPTTVLPVAVSLSDLQDAQKALRAAQTPPMIDVTPNAGEPGGATVDRLNTELDDLA